MTGLRGMALAAVCGVLTFGGAVSAGESAAAGAVPAVTAEPATWTLLEKMDFEKPGSQRNWQEDRGSRKTPRVNFKLDEDAHSGKQALRITLVAPEPAEAEPPKGCTIFVGGKMEPREEPARLRARLFVKGFDGADVNAVFSLIPRNAEGKIVGYKPEWGKVPTGADWQEVELETGIPEGVKSFAFMIRCRGFVPDASLLVDDVTFEVK